MRLCLDIGGTNIRSAFVRETKLIDYRKTKTPHKKKETIKTIFEVISSYKDVDSICVSSAGFERNGKLVNSLNNDLDGTPLTKLLKKKFRKHVFVDNDANCATLAEQFYGAGKGKKNFVMITLGSGIGGGAVMDGKLIRGQGGAIEPGSMRINGEKYLWEELASGHASVRIAHEKGLKVNSMELEDMADNHEKRAIAVYDLVGENLGIGISNLAYIFDPEIIIIGGGFSRVKYIYPILNKTFKKLYKLSPKPKIMKAELGDDAGLIGASLL